MNRQQRRRRERRNRTVLDAETMMAATGLGQHFKPTAVVDLPPKVPGRHRWILSSAYTISDEQARIAFEGVRSVLMGTDNLISFGVGCWDCEQEYRQVVAEPCTAGAS